MSLTRTSRRPCSASTRATRSATSPGSRWSTRTAMPVPPAAETRSAVSSIVSGRSYSERRVRVERPVQYTVAPASPSAIAVPRPAPRVAPATSATVPSRAATGRRLGAGLRGRLASARPLLGGGRFLLGGRGLLVVGGLLAGRVARAALDRREARL